jgi:hypothetical protein
MGDCQRMGERRHFLLDTDAKAAKLFTGAAKPDQDVSGLS